PGGEDAGGGSGGKRLRSGETPAACSRDRPTWRDGPPVGSGGRGGDRSPRGGGHTEPGIWNATGPGATRRRLGRPYGQTFRPHVSSNTTSSSASRLSQPSRSNSGRTSAAAG